MMKKNKDRFDKLYDLLIYLIKVNVDDPKSIQVIVDVLDDLVLQLK